MSEIREQLQEAYRLIKAKQKDEAREIIIPILQTDEKNANAWFLLANVLDDPNDAREALENVLAIKPDHGNARKMLDKLNAHYPPPEASVEADPFDAPTVIADADPFGEPVAALRNEIGTSAAGKGGGSELASKFGVGEIVALVSAAVILLGMFIGGLWNIIGLMLMQFSVLLIPVAIAVAIGSHLLIILGSERISARQASYVTFGAGAAVLIFPAMVLGSVLRFGLFSGLDLGFWLALLGGIGLVVQAFLPRAGGGQLVAREETPALIGLGVLLIVCLLLGLLTGGGLAGLASGLDFGPTSFDFDSPGGSGEVSVDLGNGVTVDLGDFDVNMTFADVQDRGAIGLGETRQETLSSGEQHGYTFNATAGQTVIIDLTSPDITFDTYLELLDSSGIQIDSNDDFSGLHSQLTHTFAAAGSHTIVARSFSPAASGVYELRVQGQ